MVKDIHSSGSSTPQFAAVGNTLYFAANEGNNGYELWKSDGTASGTLMAKDINPSGNSFPAGLTATRSISEPTTEPTEKNCGRAMELPQER